MNERRLYWKELFARAKAMRMLTYITSLSGCSLLALAIL